MSEDWDEDDNGPTTMTTLTPASSIYQVYMLPVYHSNVIC